MEAIFGVLHLDRQRPADADELRRVAAVVGASDPSIVVAGSFGLACSGRTTDSAGHAPHIARSVDASLLAAMTGELDNRAELALDLESAGPAVADADLALLLFQRRGTGAVARLSGFFNLVIWDRSHQRLVLAVDRCGGLRSMYWAVADGTVFFGSALKTVVAHPRVPRALDATALEETLSLGHAIPPRTLFAGVSKLAGGTLLQCSQRQRRIEAYWRPGDAEPPGEDEETLHERYFHALTHAVRRALDARPQPGVLLSGGVDSAALVSLMRRAGCDPITTVSVHTGSGERADADASRRVAQLFGTTHHAILDLDETCLDDLPTMLWHYEAPAQSIHPTYWLSRVARERCDTVIAGYGNDLVWGCFPPKRWLRGWPTPILSVASRHRYLRNRRLLGRGELRRLVRSMPGTDLGLLRHISKMGVATGSQFFDMVILDTQLFGNLRVYPDVGKLIVEAAGLSVRLPYTDRAVKAVAASVPAALRMTPKTAGGWLLKSFFKRCVDRYALLPDDLIYQRKAWMRPPTAEWLRGPLGATVGSLLLDERTLDRGQLRRQAVSAALREHRAGDADHSVALMSLAGLELWQRIYADPEQLAPPAFGLRDYAAEGCR